VRPWIQLRREVGAYHALMRELEQEDQRGFKNFVRMNKEDFEELVHRVIGATKSSFFMLKM
jgi:hypothetical protein